MRTNFVKPVGKRQKISLVLSIKEKLLKCFIKYNILEAFLSFSETAADSSPVGGLHV